MRAAVFTPEELAELALIDAEIDAAPMTQTERDESRRLDYVLRGANMDKAAEAQRAYREANREKIAEAQRAYREANREKIAEAKRAYYEANREKIAEAQRAYYEANREKIAEIGAALRRWRKEHGLTQREVGEAVGVLNSCICHWEKGDWPIDFGRLTEAYPLAVEAIL